MTLEQVQALDPAHNFVPGENTRSDGEPSEYPLRGVRTGERKPPPGAKPAGFRIPTLEEALRTYPTIPTNIEIEGVADADVASFTRNAEALAELLNRIGRSEGIIVATFNDAAIDHFRRLAPQIDLAPGIAGLAGFKLASVPPGLV
jgi:glycerophosphoryl diester phosphodiesterase